MKKSLITSVGLAILLPSMAFSQNEKEIKSIISDVTVYSKGAQIVSEANITLLQGKTLLNFTNLSPYIKKESIRVDGSGDFTILNVQHKNNFYSKLMNSRVIADLTKAIEIIQTKKEDEETFLKILNEKKEFLASNKNVTGVNTINPESLKSLIEIYGSNTEKLNIEILKRQRQIKAYASEIANIQNQIAETSGKQDLPSGEISVLLTITHPESLKIQLTYLTDSAGWYPTYDIRYVGVNQPAHISYKANIKQNTGVDWTNVKIKLSNAKTQFSAQIPDLNPNYLQFYYPQLYAMQGRASGIQNAMQGRLAGVHISDKSGSSGDILIRGLSSLVTNRLLYVIDGVEEYNIDHLNPNDIDKIDVLKDAAATAIYGSKGVNGVVIVTTKHKDEESNAPQTIVLKNETNKEFIVDDVQSILSNGKLNTIKFRDAEVKTNYEFTTIPKLSEHVYLIGRINDWYNMDLCDGEVNIYAENSFVGKSFINSSQFSDTLDISFGIDNGISVKREKIKDFSESQFMGSNKKVTEGWKIKIRNNKAYAITLRLADQIPISTAKNMQVEPLEVSEGNIVENTGEVEWTLNLKPNETKEVVLKYSIKFPKNKKVILN